MAYLGPSANGTVQLPHHSSSIVPTHPLCPLTASEITTSAQLLRDSYPAEIKLQFKAITLQEPPKNEVVEYLAAEHANKQTQPITRRSFVAYYIKNTVSSHPSLSHSHIHSVESSEILATDYFRTNSTKPFSTSTIR